MAQASGSLPSASHAVEGVPLLSLAIPQRSPIALLPSSAPTGASLSPETGALSFRNKFALKFWVRGGRCYLADYSADSGVLFGDFAYAKLFSSLEIARNLSNIFSCEVARVFICPDGTAKLALPRREPDASKGETENKINPAHREDCAGVERADGAVQTPPSFLITKPANRKRILEDGKALLSSFISTFLSTLENPVEFLDFPKFIRSRPRSSDISLSAQRVNSLLACINPFGVQRDRTSGCRRKGARVKAEISGAANMRNTSGDHRPTRERHPGRTVQELDRAQPLWRRHPVFRNTVIRKTLAGVKQTVLLLSPSHVDVFLAFQRQARKEGTPESTW